jgi:hypothetical protein
VRPLDQLCPYRLVQGEDEGEDGAAENAATDQRKLDVTERAQPVRAVDVGRLQVDGIERRHGGQDDEKGEGQGP